MSSMISSGPIGAITGLFGQASSGLANFTDSLGGFGTFLNLFGPTANPLALFGKGGSALDPLGLLTPQKTPPLPPLPTVPAAPTLGTAQATAASGPPVTSTASSGFGSTLVTGGLGDTSSATVAKKTLLGG
jgi:hypothetical protein